MDVTTTLIIICAIYGVLLFFDNFFKTCAHYPYIKFLEGTGLQIKFLTIKWQTKAFNRTLIRWGNSKVKFFNLWFNIGLYATLLLLPVAVILLLYSVLQNVAIKGETERIVLEPVVPGINLPSSELWYYCGTLVVASVVHELGHALSAVLDDVNLIEVGANIFFILPMAYVNLSTDKLFTLEKMKRLRIICAGVWHNLVLSALGFGLYYIFPFLLSMFFMIDKGVVVTNIARNSPILGHKGLNINDVVYKINNCEVTDENSWYSCLSQVKKYQDAYCIKPDLVHSLDESVPLRHSNNGNLECCDGSEIKNICFEHLDSRGGILELQSHACLPARGVIEGSVRYCTNLPHNCPENSYCFRPILGNSTYLMKITCSKHSVIYMGHPGDILHTTEISPYIPKLLFTTSFVPDVIMKFLKYVVIISFGLAIVNVLPFVYMDGEYIIEILCYILLRKRLGNEKCKLFIGIITTFFTLTLIFHCLYFFYSKILL